MATNYSTPGVYVEEISKFPPSVVQVATAVPAFIGYTEKAERGGKDLTSKPVKIRSLLDYEESFGKGVIPESVTITLDADNKVKKVEVKSKFLLYDSIRLFYDNGGGECYIVSVGRSSESKVDMAKLKGGVQAVEKLDEPTLLVVPEAINLSETNIATIYSEMLAQCKKLQDRFAIFDLIESIGSEMPSSLDGIRERFGNNDLKYAAAYFPGLQTNYTYRIGYDEIVKEGAVVKDGEPAFKVTDLFIESLYNAITAAALDEEKQEAIDTLCEIDPVYQAIADACEKETRALPPGGAIAGVYASVDRDRGVWKAPANVSLSSVIGPVFNLTDAENGELNVDSGTGKSINAIRAFTGKGTMVWGARTLAGNDNEWRYIPVRRFFIMVEESVKKATEQFVFEPNDANTWVKVRAMIENFLTLQWRAGALAGAKPEQAFYVRVGLGQTMTSQDILEGRMNIEIGMAAVRPAEFIILKFSHKMQEA